MQASSVTVGESLYNPSMTVSFFLSCQYFFFSVANSLMPSSGGTIQKCSHGKIGRTTPFHATLRALYPLAWPHYCLDCRACVEKAWLCTPPYRKPRARVRYQRCVVCRSLRACGEQSRSRNVQRDGVSQKERRQKSTKRKKKKQERRRDNRAHPCTKRFGYLSNLLFL